MNVADPESSIVDAARSAEDAEAVKFLDDAVAMSRCSTFGVSANYTIFLTPEDAAAYIQKSLQSNTFDAASEVSTVPDLSDGIIVMNPDYGSGAVHWTRGPIAASVVANFDQEKVDPSRVKQQLMTAAITADQRIQ